MARKKITGERVVYEEKPVCGRCGAGIVGVIPKWKDNKPLCRECAFELEELSTKAGRTKTEVREEKDPLTPEERSRRIGLGILLGVLLVFLVFRVYALAPMLKSPKPLRQGVTETDALTDKCINNLWRLSRDLQDGNLPSILPLCPKSLQQYIVTETEDDTAIRCPTPEEHGLADLRVSLSSPIPYAVAEKE